jgi:hypothetical protein
MSSPVFLSSSVYFHFGTSSATTGAATNADVLPVVTITENGVSMGYAPVVANVITGLYIVTIAATAANGFTAGGRYSVYVEATVGGITGRDGLAVFEVLEVDLNTGVASVTGAVGSVTGLIAANLDVAVSSRMATFATPTNFGALAITAGGTVTAALDTADETKLDDLHQIHGLKTGTNLLVTPTSRVAGIIAQTISVAGSDTTVSRP